MLKNEELAGELETIRLQDPLQRLHPKAVVEAVRGDENHRLRDYFTWDKDEALDKIQLIEARQLIRVVVMDVPGSTDSVRAYVSLTPDRKGGEDGSGGYRSTVEVMGDKELRSLMLRDALTELRTFERKYRKLEALGPIFDAYQALVSEEEPENRSRKKSRRASKASKKKKAGKKKAKKKAKARSRH
jgi:hypothetical protein